MIGASRYVAVAGVAATVTFVATPLVEKFARRVGWVVEPDARRVHTKATPDVGGIAMFLGFLAAMAAAWAMGSFRSIFAGNSEALGLLVGCGVVFLVGLVDDIKEISAPAKVTGIVLGAVVFVIFGVNMYY
ncbi:MAG: undecaprenyl/decaprenyl-phosphate alpha-N-acetylglucosaminyl 1-phosphate transferase, partial [Actinobacteria bacterium]|nr:undecaprenyl/decaprenyl-phosphate alpha-N-acetylglucosaminyl 1-phosphate transferase [Actinomycetota bacterium]